MILLARRSRQSISTNTADSCHQPMVLVDKPNGNATPSLQWHLQECAVSRSLSSYSTQNIHQSWAATKHVTGQLIFKASLASISRNMPYHPNAAEHRVIRRPVAQHLTRICPSADDATSRRATLRPSVHRTILFMTIYTRHTAAGRAIQERYSTKGPDGRLIATPLQQQNQCCCFLGSSIGRATPHDQTQAVWAPITHHSCSNIMQ